MAKVESLHGTNPAEIFESGIVNLDRIEAAAAVLWKDGTVTAGWSNAGAATIAFMIDTLKEESRVRNLRGGSD
jgi:hypothetical protein